MLKLCKPERTKLPKLLKSYMETLGATKTDPGSLEFSLLTHLGVLNLSYHNDEDGYFPTLFTRFDNPDLAKSIVDCNPYSGKYNCHVSVFKNMTALDVLSQWEQHLRPILCLNDLGLLSSKFVLSLYA